LQKNAQTPHETVIGQNVPLLNCSLDVKNSHKNLLDKETMLMDGWKSCQLGNILTFQRGYDLPKKQMVSGEYPVVGSNGIIGFHNEYTTEAPSITIGRSGNTGNPFIVYGRTWSHNTTLYIKEYRESDPIYVYYLLKTLDLGNFAGGSAVPTLNRNHIHTLDISVPPLAEQIEIGRTLRVLDDKIELNNRMNKTLEEMAQAKFDDIFPSVSVGDSTIGEYIIPKRGKTLISKDTGIGDVPVIAGGLVPTVYHNAANTQEPVITISASGANAGFVNLWNIPVWSSDSSFIDKLMTDDVYFWYVMLKKRQNEIYESQTGSAQPHIYPAHIARMSTIPLDNNKIAAFTTFVTPLFEMIAVNLAENARLAETRDALLPKLMSGEVPVGR